MITYKGFSVTDECQADAMLKACGVKHDVNEDSIEIAKPLATSKFTVIKHTHPFDKYEVQSYVVAFNENEYDGIVRYQLSLIDGSDLNALLKAFGEVSTHV